MGGQCAVGQLLRDHRNVLRSTRLIQGRLLGINKEPSLAREQAVLNDVLAIKQVLLLLFRYLASVIDDGRALLQLSGILPRPHDPGVRRLRRHRRNIFCAKVLDVSSGIHAVLQNRDLIGILDRTAQRIAEQVLTRRIEANLNAIKVGRHIHVLPVRAGHTAFLTTLGNALALALHDVKAHVAQSNVRNQAQQLTLGEPAPDVLAFRSFVNS